MSNQPPARPWFRLASLRPVSAPPALAPEPRPSLVQPTIRTNPAPSPPQAQPSPPPPPSPPVSAPSPQPATADKGSGSSSPVQKSPVKSSSPMPTSLHPKASVTTFSTDSPSSSSSSFSSPAKGVTTARGSSPTTKPVVQTPTQSSKVKPITPQTHSPKIKPITPPPSPLTLPPSQLKANSAIEPKIPVEAESKNVIVQKTIEKPKQWLNGKSGETLKIHNEKQKGNPRKVSDSEESGMKIITIAGENRGAYMELIHHQKKHEIGDKPNYLYKIGNSKTKSDNGESDSSSSDEGNANKKENKINRGRTQSPYPMSAFMNSNVQCVNNSILYNTSCTHNDPGVRLSLSKKPFGGEGFHLKEIVTGKHD